MNTKFKYILFFLIFALLGLSREFLFVNINNQLYKLFYGHSNIPLPSTLSFLNALNYSTLYYGKFGLTLVYLFLYFITTYLCIKSITHNAKFTLWIIYIYVSLIFLAAIIMIFNFTVNNQLDGDEYTVSRWLLGIAQSPLVAFFIIASSPLLKLTKIQKN